MAPSFGKPSFYMVFIRARNLYMEKPSSQIRKGLSGER